MRCLSCQQTREAINRDTVDEELFFRKEISKLSTIDDIGGRNFCNAFFQQQTQSACPSHEVPLE